MVLTFFFFFFDPPGDPGKKSLRSIHFRLCTSFRPYVSDFCKIGRVVYPLWGTTPRNFQFAGTGVVAALQPVNQLEKAGPTINIRTAFFGLIAIVSLHARWSSL